MLDAWHTQTKPKEPQEKLVQEIIDKVNVEWVEVRRKNPDKLITEFKDTLSVEMKNRGLNPLQMSIILKAIK
jgi:dTDP-4-dehydrorhamnose 3,5-epimerase-like enzyme